MSSHSMENRPTETSIFSVLSFILYNSFSLLPVSKEPDFDYDYWVKYKGEENLWKYQISNPAYKLILPCKRH